MGSMCLECNHEWNLHDKQECCCADWKCREDTNGGLLSSSNGCDFRLAHVDHSQREIETSKLVIA